MWIFKQCVLGLYLCTYFVTAILPLNVRPRRESIRQQKAFLQPKTCFSYFVFLLFLAGASIQGRTQIWMDANGGEVTLWQQMLERPNFWVEGSVPLRTSEKLQGGSSAWRLKKHWITKPIPTYKKISTSLLLLTNMTTPTTTNTKPNSVIHYSSLSFLIHDTMYFVSLFSVSLTMINKWIHSEKKFCISWYLFLTSKSCIFTAGLVSEFGMMNLAKEKAVRYVLRSFLFTHT